MTGSSRWPGRWRIWRGRKRSGRSTWRRRFSIGCWTASFGSERLSGGLNYKKKEWTAYAIHPLDIAGNFSDSLAFINDCIDPPFLVLFLLLSWFLFSPLLLGFCSIQNIVPLYIY